jgi:replicative DNA helicase
MNFETIDQLANPAERLSSIQVEQRLLSMFMLPNVNLEEVAAGVTADSFYFEPNKHIFSAIQSFAIGGEAFELGAMLEKLKGVVDFVYFNEVASCNDHGTYGISRLVKLLLDLQRARQLYSASEQVSALAFEEGSIDDRIDRAQAVLSGLQQNESIEDWVDAYTAAMQHTALIEMRERGEIVGMASGLSDLDEMLDGGFVRGNLVVVGARPAMGKTSFAMSIGLHLASEYHTGMLSMEMPHSDLRDRQTAILGRIAIGSIKRPKKGQGLDWDAVVDGVERSRHLKWYASDKSGLNILQVRSMARRLKRSKGLDVLIVDYIGLMSGLDPKQARAYQIEEISRGLKSLAKELNIVVVCLAQVNRGAAEKQMQPPGLHELRDSGAIEQDADVVMFPHRPIAANPSLDAQWQNYAVCRVAKNRQGRTGDVHLFFHGESTRFEAWGGTPPSLTTSSATKTHRGME